MSKPTPGPWEVDGRQVCIVRGCALATIHGDDSRATANARLIAAAPTMLELLRRTADVLRMRGARPGDGSDLLYDDVLRELTRIDGEVKG